MRTKSTSSQTGGQQIYSPGMVEEKTYSLGRVQKEIHSMGMVIKQT